MWFDPDAGLTWEQIVAKVWRELSPRIQQQLQDRMAQTGESFSDICRDARAGYQARWEAAQQDPNHPFARELEFMTYPCGRDPLLAQSDV